MATNDETAGGSGIGTKLIAMIVLAIGAYVLFKIVIGIVTGIAITLAVILAVVAVIWALGKLL